LPPRVGVLDAHGDVPNRAVLRIRLRSLAAQS